MNIIIVHSWDVVFTRAKALRKTTPLGWTIMMFTIKYYVPRLSGNVSIFAFRNYNLDRKLKTQIWSLWKHKIRTHK
jgi:hypothetical protein